MFVCVCVCVSSGGMQDYNYVWAQCLELTLEVSCCKFPPTRELPALWAENKRALLAFIQQVHLGQCPSICPPVCPPVYLSAPLLTDLFTSVSFPFSRIIVTYYLHVCVSVSCSGVKGRVFDSSGVPVQNAVVEVIGRRNMCPFRTDRHGEYYRLLLPGNYSFSVDTHTQRAIVTSSGRIWSLQSHCHMSLTSLSSGPFD